MKKRSVILFLIIAICISGCELAPNDSVLGAYGGSGEQQTESVDNSKADVTLLYYPDMDTNPITTTCLANHQVLKLIYLPLVRQNASFMPEGVVAESFVQNGKTVTVVIKDAMKFSDGSSVTSQDVVKSVSVAKKSGASPYNASAKLIAKCYAKDEKTVVFEFSEQLYDAAGYLDIPIMKDGKVGIGCGPYKLSESNGKNILIANGHYPKTPGISVLKLVETKTDEYVSTLFSAGELDFLSLTGDDDLSLSSLRNYSTLTYPSNNLVYIGVNTKSEKLSDAKLRTVLSECIDREKIASQTLANLAQPTIYPYNPSYYKMTVYNVDCNPKITPDTSGIAEQKLELLISDSSTVKLSIANALAESFKAYGITLDIKSVNADKYHERVRSGEYELYLGETAIGKGMDSSYLFTTGGSLNFSGYSDAELDSAAAEYRKTGEGFDKYLTVFYRKMPIIPIVFRKNVMYTSQTLEGFEGQTAWDSYGNFESIKQK